MLVARDPHAEMHVRLSVLRLAARTNVGDRLAFLDRRTLVDSKRAEMSKRDRISGAGDDREREAVRRYRSCERHGAARRSADGVALRCGDIDATVLAAGVGVGPEREGLEDGPGDRPCPRSRNRRERQSEDGRACRHYQAHWSLPVSIIDNSASLARTLSVVKFAYKDAR
jgi:hypothetical protein